MKVTHISTGKVKRICDIEVGTTFTGHIGSHRGLFLRTFSEVVFLEDPENTWTAEDRLTPIDDYREVEAEIVVRRYISAE